MSWKRIPPSLLARLRRGRRAGVTSSLAALAVVAAVVTVFGYSVPVEGTIVVITIVGFYSAWKKGQSSLLPSTLVDELRDEPEYRATYCTAAQLQQACEMTKPHYGNEYVPASVAEQWRIRDPRAFVAITNAENELCACFGMLALSSSFTDIFYKGQCMDTRLNAEDIMPSEKAKSSPKLYISGVVVREAGTHKGRKRARVMLWALLDYYRRRFGFRKDRRLFGLAVTPESETLLKTCGFQLVSEGSGRLDKCNLYELQMSKSAWEKISAKVWDLSSICRADWT